MSSCCDKCTPDHSVLTSPLDPAVGRSHTFTVDEYAVRLTGANLGDACVEVFKQLSSCDETLPVPYMKACGCPLMLSASCPQATLLYPGTYFITITGDNIEDAVVVQEPVTTNVQFLEGGSGMSCNTVSYSCDPATGAVTLTGADSGPCTITPGDNVVATLLPNGDLLLQVNSDAPLVFPAGSQVSCDAAGVTVDGVRCDFPVTTASLSDNGDGTADLVVNGTVIGEVVTTDSTATVSLADNGDCTAELTVNGASVGTVVTEAKEHDPVAVNSTDSVFTIATSGPDGQVIDITFNSSNAAAQLAANGGAIAALCAAFVADPACMADIAAATASAVVTGAGISGNGTAGSPLVLDPASMSAAQLQDMATAIAGNAVALQTLAAALAPLLISAGNAGFPNQLFIAAADGLINSNQADPASP